MTDIVERLNVAAKTAEASDWCSVGPNMLYEAAAEITRLRALVEEMGKIADRIDRQVKASDGYAEEYARADEMRPTTWQISNSHFTDLARELRTLAKAKEQS
jgi:hypothetical protein